ncbi:trans-aconitate 2-methyltransferase [Paracoccus sp. p4-l81]|uniref:class I SAM-dependent methyltransferase n=1 Tax=unclassified Paracoccus (in: a-proteobacteria) TaxID=2688777 RepID=UPI0035BAA58D
MRELTAEQAFYTLHRDLPREGPGTSADLAWALYVAGTPEDARICDAGCGPGADTVGLAKARAGARIDAIDAVAHLVEAARLRAAPYGDRIRVQQGDMADLSGPYDLIWCAGALYFLGVTEGLSRWRGALSAHGRVAFSEPCLLPRPSAAAEAFWADYPQITNAQGIRDRVHAAGYRVLGEHLMIGAPWEAYYKPLAARIARLRPDATGALAAALDDAEAEIARWQAAPGEIAYALMVVEPDV